MSKHKKVVPIEVAPVAPSRKVVKVGSLADALYVADCGSLPYTANAKLQKAIDSLGIDRALQLE